MGEWSQLRTLNRAHCLRMRSGRARKRGMDRHGGAGATNSGIGQK